uniref:RING-type E3 ubiquitin transferase n=1 Tax=Tetraodon nigroviridis TaxID=99883 RepID=H3C3U7_TETNG
MLKEWKAEPCFYNVPKSEAMKERGNRFFEKKQYKEAIKFYTEAISCYPENYLIYGNRALCYIRSHKYLKAVGDGKRAILLEPLWPKGHYRYCEALFSLGEVDMAIYNNTLAMHYCQGDKSSLKDLEQQHLKFHSLLAGFKGIVLIPYKLHVQTINWLMWKFNVYSFNMNLFVSRSHKIKWERKQRQDPSANSNMKIVDPILRLTTFSEFFSETSAEAQQVKADSLAGSSNATKKKPKLPAVSQNEVRQDSSSAGTLAVSSAASVQSEFTKARLCKELSCTVQDAHTALSDLRSANAEQAFRRALALMGTTTPKDLGLSTQDELLLLYGHASALTDIGQPEELAEAQRVLEKMKSFEERKFQCLVFYGIGRVFVRENRFAVALEPFRDSLQMVKNHIVPGKLTWPFTKEVVKETQPNYLKASLEEAIDLCRFPPPPNAICRTEKCPGKAEIYFTDPDFKGFIRLCCCQSCVVEYHTACWKVLKATSFSKKNEKEFLQGPCLTPDCVGQICSIKIFDPTGLAKHKFEEAVPKAERQKKPKVNQKCTSLKKLKSKEERRNRRKQHQQARQQMQVTSSEAQPQKEDSVCQPPQKGNLPSSKNCIYRDPVLLQISQNMELLREEKSLQVATLASALRPWLRLDSTKNNQLALKLLSWEKERLETVGQFVEVLLERENRVWARVFIQVLGDCGDVNPKLYNWACYLNDAGLKAATSFLERYSRELEQLDLTILLQFELLQEMFLEKLGSKPDDLPSIGLSVTEYLKQAPAHDTRLFIWALEEHRDQYDPFHSILDQYFDMMDGHCSIIQKSNENKNVLPAMSSFQNSPLKIRVRKKKQKESKAVFPVQGAMLRGRRGLTSRDEWDQDFSEDESFDPFRVPSHIQRQVAEFELQYNSRGQNNFLDNNPDPTTESLYDYFAQILQEHGPLDPEDPLLVGQLDDFPLVAQTSIRESGGLQTFLLQSLRFIRVGSLIGLANHAVLQQ